MLGCTQTAHLLSPRPSPPLTPRSPTNGQIGMVLAEHELPYPKDKTARASHALKNTGHLPSWLALQPSWLPRWHTAWLVAVAVGALSGSWARYPLPREGLGWPRRPDRSLVQWRPSRALGLPWPWVAAATKRRATRSPVGASKGRAVHSDVASVF